ncbi:MAG TPA: enoyl-CoA hydratase-related protein [Gaiellales bacterium]
MTAEPQLFELHDLARERGIEGYRRLSKAELLGAIGELPPPAPTTVETSVKDGLAVLTLRGPGGDNALALETIEQLADEAERLSGDQAVRVIAITGAGNRVFCAGADLPRVRGLPGTEVTERGSRACDRIAAVPVPTLAVLNGHAVGGGIDLALACDWRIAAQGAKLRFIHNELGYCPPWGGAQRLARLLGPGAALRLFATCELLSADEARTLGLVDAVVPHEKLHGRAEALAGRVARAGRAAVAATKPLLGAAEATGHEQAFAALWDATASDDGATMQA